MVNSFWTWVNVVFQVELHPYVAYETGAPVELANEGSPGALDEMLRDCRSAWKVGMRDGKLGLVKRVPDAVQDAADKAILSSGHPGRHLSQAWSAAFGFNPDPTKAYSLAVKAVEDAAVPVVSPNDLQATLGKVINQMKNQRDWSLPMQKESPHANSGETLINMTSMLWAGQADRHGGPEHLLTVITQEEAEIAVITAVALVQWFTSEFITRRQP